MIGNEISDASAVMNLYNLKELGLTRNNISNDQISRIKAAIPECVIKRWKAVCLGKPPQIKQFRTSIPCKQMHTLSETIRP